MREDCYWPVLILLLDLLKWAFTLESYLFDYYHYHYQYCYYFSPRVFLLVLGLVYQTNFTNSWSNSFAIPAVWMIIWIWQKIILLTTEKIRSNLQIKPWITLKEMSWKNVHTSLVYLAFSLQFVINLRWSLYYLLRPRWIFSRPALWDLF